MPPLNPDNPTDTTWPRYQPDGSSPLERIRVDASGLLHDIDHGVYGDPAHGVDLSNIRRRVWTIYDLALNSDATPATPLILKARPGQLDAAADLLHHIEIPSSGVLIIPGDL